MIWRNQNVESFFQKCFSWNTWRLNNFYTEQAPLFFNNYESEHKYPGKQESGMYFIFNLIYANYKRKKSSLGSLKTFFLVVSSE